MCSVMSAAQDVEALLSKLGSSAKHAHVGRLSEPPLAFPPLVLPWPGMESVLPDGGFPRGVIELTAPKSLGGATSLALAAVNEGQKRSRGAWCAWVDPDRTLFAPGVASRGIDLGRLLVVCPPREE